MVKRTDCYVDTSALIAFLDQSDSYHPLFRRLFSQPPALVTSALVIAEGHAWFLRRYDQRRAIQFLAFIESMRDMQVHACDSGELAAAGAVIKKYGEQRLTLADAHGLTIMNTHKIATCWSTDRHLELMGVSLVTEPRSRR